MRTIALDASAWATAREFLDALRKSVDATADADLDTIAEALIRGKPCTIRFTAMAHAPAEVRAEIEKLAQMIEDARLWRGNHGYGVAGATIETSP